jgi:hypothetical protein
MYRNYTADYSSLFDSLDIWQVRFGEINSSIFVSLDIWQVRGLLPYISRGSCGRPEQEEIGST